MSEPFDLEILIQRVARASHTYHDGIHCFDDDRKPFVYVARNRPEGEPGHPVIIREWPNIDLIVKGTVGNYSRRHIAQQQAGRLAQRLNRLAILKEVGLIDAAVVEDCERNWNFDGSSRSGDAA
ncbi:hypothetical protein DBT53_002635, partial [Aerococcus mictus]|uniref:hypothetical protein n=1 Tax=Aerococcus mictus TaxID=2976810 RepID=UPI000DCF2EAE|nr:hypothetical protein DBT53_12180 [Aerococcus mictus]RAW01944.1 hypothetical protein DBT41_12870 [Aerococcus urinae]